NFNRAATELHITQPALSKSMKALEDEIGVILLERGAAGVFPTPYGKIVASSARLALGELRRSLNEVNALATRGSGKVILGGGIVVKYLLPEIHRTLRGHGPPLQLEIVEMLRAPLLAALMNGEVDIAVCSADDAYVHGRVQLPLLEDEMTVVAHRSHPLFASPETLAPAALAPYPWILPRADEVERHQLELAFLNAGLARPDVRIETTSVSVMASIIGMDEGLSYLPRRALAMDRTLHELRPLPVTLPWQPRRVSLFHRESSLELDHIHLVIEAVQHVARQAP
ncbi:MAG: LysR family transcriptional regulator, partial [Pigmentiphaga sp.]